MFNSDLEFIAMYHEERVERMRTKYGSSTSKWHDEPPHMDHMAARPVATSRNLLTAMGRARRALELRVGRILLRVAIKLLHHARGVSRAPAFR